MLAAFSAEGGPVLVLARGGADAALLSSFGALLFRTWLAPAVLARLGANGARPLTIVAGLSLVAAAVLAGGWVAAESVDLAGSVMEAPLVLRETLFGHLMLARFALLALAAFAVTRRWFWLATAFAGAAVIGQAGQGHALAMHEGPSWLLLSGALHLLAAAAWLGGLLPLWLLVRSAAPDECALACARFAGLGTACVLVLAVTAFYQASVLMGALPGWPETGYGQVGLVKLTGFLALLALAAHNRFRLSPAIRGARPAEAKRRLLRNIVGETVVGLLVVLAAGLLASLAPNMPM